MNAEIFCEHFATFANAPESIAALRQMILQLAVKGKLLPQNRSDEPVEALLTKISPFQPPSRYASRSREVIPGDCGLSIGRPATILPEGWDWVELVKVAKLESGHTPSRSRPDWWGGDIPWIGVVDARIHNGGVIDETIQHTNESGIANSAARVLPAGTVCFSRTASIGYVVIMGRPMATSQDFVNWVPSEALYSRWLQLVLQAERPAMAKFSKGAVHQTVYFPAWLSMHIALPPLAEQRRIVERVDQLLGLCDELAARQAAQREKRQRLVGATLDRLVSTRNPAEFPTHAHRLRNHFDQLFDTPTTIPQLRQTILQLAVQGQLVPQDPNDENVVNLLAKNDERRQQIAENDHRADVSNQSLLSADDRWAIPATWSWRGLADLVLFVDYRGKTPAKLPSGIRLITAKNVRKGQIDLCPEEFLSEREYSQWMTRGVPKSGDVLFTTEAPMGNAAVVELTERFALAQRVICFQGYGGIDSAFLVMQILSEPFQCILDKNGTGVTAKGIKASKLKQFPIAVPPLAEQKRIVTKVTELLSLCDALEAKLTQAESASTQLLSAAVHHLLAPQQ